MKANAAARRRTWSVGQAKAELSLLLQRALSGPQIIRRRGKEIAVVVGVEEYRRVADAADAAEPAARWKRFLGWAAEFRRTGGAALRPPSRTPRPSPFGPR